MLKLYRVICLGMVFALDMPQSSAAWADSLFLTADHTQGSASESPVTATCQTSLPEKLWLHQRVLRAFFAPVVSRYATEERQQDLSLSNFFSDGWGEGWVEPEEGPRDAPRFRLLRIQRAFWEREVRLTYNYTFGADDGHADEQEGEMELELPLSRRFLVEFEGGVVGLRPEGRAWKGRGGDLKIIPEVMLAETHTLSFSSGLVVRTPTGSQTIGEGRTSVTPYLAFWKDLGRRIGLHTYLGTEFPVSGFAAGTPDAVLQYGIAPAITMTPKNTPYWGNLTLFLETNGETNISRRNDQTTVTLLPGTRWLVFKDVWLAGGYEFPVAGTDELHGRMWLSLYLDF